MLKSDPNHATALRGLGYSYLMKQDLAKAGEYFHKSAQLQTQMIPVSSITRPCRTSARPRLSAAMLIRWDLCKANWSKSVKLDPNFADAHNMLAFAYRSQGKRDPAIASMRRAIGLNPRNDQYQFNLASLYLENQQVDEATSDSAVFADQ